MNRAERLARMRAVVDDLRGRSAAAMRDLGGDNSPGAYFTGYASIALDELAALLVEDEKSLLEVQEKPHLVRAREQREERPARTERFLNAPRTVGVGGIRR